MKATRKVSRRSFMRKVLGGVAGGTLAVVSGPARAQTGVTDGDPAPPQGDPVGGGRGGRQQQPGGNTGGSRFTGVSDHDPTDRTGEGRGSPPHPRSTDNDGGDAPGEGRFTGVSDRDASDRTGEGRGRPPRPRITDNDGGDPVGMGRHTGITDHDSTDRSGEGQGPR